MVFGRPGSDVDSDIEMGNVNRSRREMGIDSLSFRDSVSVCGANAQVTWY